MSIVLFTRKTEENVLRLTEVSDNLAIPSFVITSEDYCSEAMNIATYFSSDADPRTHINLMRRGLTNDIELNQISGVWTRGIDFGPKPNIGDHAKNSTFHEWKYYINYLTRAVEPKRWVNFPPALQETGNKPYQLNAARKYGFNIPPTLITNSVSYAKGFYEEHREIIIKLIGEGIPSEMGDRGIFTKRITDVEQLEQVRYCPSLLQKALKKKFDLRITVVDGNVFPAALDHDDQISSYIDSRQNDLTERSYFRYNLKDNVSEKIAGFVRLLGLRYAALDFVVDVNDDLYFLEINNSGQWSFIEYMTGYPISESIIKALAP